MKTKRSNLYRQSLCFEPDAAGASPPVMYRVSCKRGITPTSRKIRSTTWFLTPKAAFKEVARLTELGADELIVTKYVAEPIDVHS